MHPALFLENETDIASQKILFQRQTVLETSDNVIPRKKDILCEVRADNCSGTLSYKIFLVYTNFKLHKGTNLPPSRLPMPCLRTKCEKAVFATMEEYRCPIPL